MAGQLDMPEVRGSLSWVSGAPARSTSTKSSSVQPVSSCFPHPGGITGGARTLFGPVLPMVATKLRGRRRPSTLAARALTDDPVCADVDHALQLVAPRLGRRGRRWPENALNAIDPIVFRRQSTVSISSLATADPRLSLVAGPMVTESDRLRTSKGHPPCHPNALIWPHFARSSRRTAPARCSQRHGQPTWRSCGFGLGGSAAICSSG